MLSAGSFPAEIIHRKCCLLEPWRNYTWFPNVRLVFLSVTNQERIICHWIKRLQSQRTWHTHKKMFILSKMSGQIHPPLWIWLHNTDIWIAYYFISLLCFFLKQAGKKIGQNGPLQLMVSILKTFATLIWYCGKCKYFKNISHRIHFRIIGLK